MGVIVQFGGQTPLNLAKALEAEGVPIIGTSPESIDLAEDRERFRLVIERLGLRQTPQRLGHPLRGGAADRRANRLPGRRPPQLRAGRPGHGDRLRRAQPRPLHDRGRRGQPRAPDPDRQVPGGCHRGRRGRRLRRPAHDRRRRDGAHRGGGHPLRRQRLRHPAVLAPGIDRRPAQGADLRPGPGAPGPGTDEHPVRRQGRRDLRARGQPSGLANRSLRVQGHRAEPGAGCRPDHGRQVARGSRGSPRSRSPGTSR